MTAGNEFSFLSSRSGSRPLVGRRAREEEEEEKDAIEIERHRLDFFQPAASPRFRHSLMRTICTEAHER